MASEGERKKKKSTVQEGIRGKGFLV